MSVSSATAREGRFPSAGTSSSERTSVRTAGRRASTAVRLSASPPRAAWAGGPILGAVSAYPSRLQPSCSSGSRLPAHAAGPTLAARLDRALKVPHVDFSRTAALAVDLRTGAVVYARNPSLSLIPASNEKLPVAYAALSLLGPGYRFHTEVVGSGTLVGDVWHGDLWLRGFGDPTLEPADLDALAAEVASWGIRRVDGAVIGDESWFDALRVGPGWKPRFYIEESPPLSALVVSRGRYRGRTSANPALAAASLFRQALEAKGVHVAGRTRSGVLTQMGLPSPVTSPSRSRTSSGSWAARATTTPPRCS